MKKTSVVELNHVTKKYILHHEKPTFAEQLMRRSNREEFTALSNINLKIYKGEKVGIIGSNGSGKTTLLKVISGITTPTRGKIITIGKIVSLIDLEAGFHPELTGEENIFLNGLIVGMTKNEIKQRFQEIVEFADIGQFINSPLYTYSDGMKLRLGFSVAVHADPDILILDEGIGVGDRNFQKKSRKKIQNFFKLGKTILLVSHWLEFIEQNCARVVWVESGKVKASGPTERIMKLYRSQS